MKKILVAALIGSMVLSLTACGGESKESTENAITGESISSEAASTDASSAENTESSEDAASVEDSSSAEDAGEEVIAPDFSGTYTEPLSGRCTIDITSTGNNNYTVNVHWSSSAFESSNWEINATYYDSTTLLEYTDAKYYIRTYTSEEEYTDDVKYTNGAGEFWFEEDGSLGWRSANSDVDYITGETTFERIDNITE